MDDQVSLTLKGKAGKEEIEKIMAGLRAAEISSLGGIPLACMDDYELQIGKRFLTGADTPNDSVETYPLTLPRSNVIRYSFAEGGFVMARPSGTEPKIKFYFNIKCTNSDTLVQLVNRIKKEFLGQVEKILERPLNLA
jgi:phosphoglucomutase